MTRKVDRYRRATAFRLLMNDYYEWLGKEQGGNQKLVVALGVAATTLRRWLNGESTPSWEKIEIFKNVITSRSKSAQ